MDKMSQSSGCRSLVAGALALEEGVEFESFQYRVGSSYFPNQTVFDPIESWYLALATFDKVRDIEQNPSNVSSSDYLSGGKFLLGHPLERDSRLNLSGIPLNNSSVLELRVQIAAANTETQQYQIFIEFISVARTFVNKTSLKI